MDEANQWLKRDRIAAAALLAGLPIVQVIALGADGPLLGAAAASANCLAGLILLQVAKPPQHFYQAILWPALLLLAGLCWAVWPDVVRAVGLPDDLAAQSERIAPDLVWSDFSRGLGAIALLVGAAALGYRRGLMHIALDWLCSFGIAALLLGLILRHLDPFHVWGFDKGILVHRFTGTMLNANAMGTVYGALAVLALGGLLSLWRGGLLVRGNRKISLAVYLLLFGAGIGAAGLTGSRTAMAGAVGGSALLCMLYLAGEHVSRFNRVLIWGAVIFLAAALLIGGMAAMSRLGHLPEDTVKRVQLWHHFVQLALNAHPFGAGLGSFSDVNLANLPPSALATDLWYVNSAHNVVLQMIIEGGIGYPMLVGAGLALIQHRILTTHALARRGELLVVAIQAALLVILAGAMVDVALNIPAVVTLAASLLGLAWGQSLRRTATVQDS